MEPAESSTIGTAAGRQLSIAIGTEQPQHFWPIVELIAFAMIEDQRQWFAVPNERFGKEAASLVVAALSETLLVSPLAILRAYPCTAERRKVAKIGIVHICGA
jgi:hypothetical protein